MKKTLLNIFYNAVYQIFLVVVPLITMPYLSRVLGPGTYGIYSYVNNSIQFLLVISNFAVGYVGMRTIARVRATKGPEELTKAFWGMWYFQVVASVLVLVLTTLFVTFIHIKYWNYFYLMLPFLVSGIFDIAWFFQGLAEFGKVVLRNTLVKAASIVLIFIFVKSPADIGIYMLIMAISTMLGSFVFWFNIRDYVGKPTKSFYQRHTSLIALVTLLIPQIATQIYTLLDKPILGAFQSSTQVSFYDNSQKISTLILGVITSITIVMMPKMASEEKERQQVILRKSLEATVMLGLIFAVVVMINTKQFVPFFFGKKYIPMTPLMFFFTVTIVLVPVGEVFGNQFAIANNRDKEFAIPVIVGAVLEMILALILDRIWGAAGATVAVLATQTVVCLLRIWIVRDDFKFKYVFRDIPKYFLIAAVTFIAGMFLPNLLHSTFLNMAFKSIIVMALYTGLMFLFKFDLNQDIIALVKRMLKRNS